MKHLMPHANPAKIFHTVDNMEWTLLERIPDYEKLNRFRWKNQCKPNGSAKRQRIRFPCCREQYAANRCKFVLLAMKTTKHAYHVYTHGKHNHPLIKRRSSSKRNLFWT